MLRRLVILSVLLGTLGVPQLAPPTALAATTCGPGVRGDIDGNGTGDLVVGANRYYSGGRPGTTFDVIRYPGGERTSIDAVDIDGTVESSVSLRRAAIGDLNGDGCADLAFAADQNTVPVTAGTRVYVVPGSPHGLVLDRATRIDVPGDHVQQIAVLRRSAGSQVAVTTTTAARQNALHIVTLNNSLGVLRTNTITAASLGIALPWNELLAFGSSLAASGRTFAVGNPSEKVGKKFIVGAVHLFTSTDAAPTTFRHTRITEDSSHIPGRGLDGSSFGARLDLLDGRLVIAAPDKQVVRKNNYANNAGQVFLLRWHEASRTYTYVRSFNQNTKGVPGTAEPWDRLGMNVLLARGLTKPGSYDVVTTVREGIGSAAVAGGLVLTNFDKAGYRWYSQASPGIPGDVGTEHWFGWELARRSGGVSDSLVTAATDRQQACGAGLLMESSGVPLAEARWTLVPPVSGDQQCPNSWPYSLAR